jgi:Tol biopolymer transport system component
MLDEAANDWFPHVSPDGNRVAYIAYRVEDVAPGDHPANKHVEIRLMSAAGGPSRAIVELFGGQGTLNVNSWSPDSQMLAFVSYRLKS